MTNGCICCTLREDLLQEVTRLAREGRFDYLLIESTGISEPLPVAETFTFPMEDETSLSDIAQLDTMVTVVDARNILDKLQTLDTLADLEIGVDEEDERSIADLLVDQLEFADVLILNKTDLVSDKDVNRIKALLQRMNPRAKLIQTQYGRIAPTEILNTGRFDFEVAASFDEWLSDEIHTPETEEYGIHSFVYRQPRPFHPARLYKAITEDDLLEDVIRSKGICWLATRHDMAGMWSQAGLVISLDPAGTWWADASEDEIPDEMRDDIASLIQGEYGDRRQELVFIGVEMKEAVLRDRLDACLLTDDEMQQPISVWATYSDPFPDWDEEHF